MPISSLRSFFSFYGSKTKIVNRYPSPISPIIVEPFAGAAAYATRYYDRQVVLIEKDPIVAGVWDWLIKVSVDDFMRLPDTFRHIDDLNVCQEAKWFLGFNINRGSAQPKKTPALFCSWGEKRKNTVAAQLEKIRHWKVIHGSYEQAPEIKATWFIDPPYIGAGKWYRHSASGIDFEQLGSWCRARVGQVMVCENTGAEWLPFRFLTNAPAASSRGIAKTSPEVIWMNGEQHEGMLT